MLSAFLFYINVNVAINEIRTNIIRKAHWIFERPITPQFAPNIVIL